MKEVKGNVSYTLLERRKISDYLDSLQGKKVNLKGFENIIKDLVGMGDQVVSVCISKLKFADEDLLHKLSYILEVLGGEEIIVPLLQIVRDPDLSDNHKAVILNILCNLGVDPVDLPIEEIFEDFDQIAENAVKKIMNDIKIDEHIPLFLDEFSAYPEDVKFMLIDEFVNEGTDSAATVLGYIARTYDFELVTPAIQGLGKIGTPKAVAILLDLVGIPEIRLNALASKELQKLKMLGVEQKRAKGLGRKNLGDIYRVIVSSIDGKGSRLVWFVWHIANRKTLLYSVNFLINTTKGIKDCWGFNKATESEIYKMLKNMGDGISFLEVDFDYAVALIRDALSTNLENGHPIPIGFGYWSTSFKPNLLYPELFKPDFSSLDIPGIMDNEDLYEGSNLLHESREFSDWFVAEPEVYDYADKYLELENKFKHKDSYKAQLDSLRERFIKQFLLPQKEQIKLNLERTIDFLIKMREFEKAGVAMAALLNIDDRPYTKQPLINRIFWESINVAIDNMRNGFDMRKNPEVFE